MFNLYVPPSSISRDEYHPIQTCYRCYRVDDHTTTLCPQPSSYTICSLCASRDHNWKYWNSKKRKCCNCDGEHSALAMSCSIPKSVVLRERSKKASTSPITYASAAASSIPGTAASFIKPCLLADTLKSYSCIILAILKNEELPGSFGSSLDMLFAANDLPKLRMGEFQPLHYLP